MSVALVEVVTTVAAEADAVRLARRLVETRRAACVTFFPVRSVYRWEGAVQEEGEFQVVAKTTAAAADALVAALREVHPYDTPAILVLPVARSGAEYAAWVVAETAGDGSP